MTRLRLGLTDYERQEQDSNRRTRNCFIAIAVLMVLGSVFIGFDH